MMNDESPRNRRKFIVHHSSLSIMPQRSRVCEAQRRIVDLDRGLRCEPLDCVVDRLLVLARDQLFGQLCAPVVELRATLFGCVRLSALLEFEYVKAVV